MEKTEPSDLEEKSKDRRKIRVKTYFNEEDFLSIIKDAEKVGKRRVGLKSFTQKPNGLENEKWANTDGVSRFLKYCWKYWKEDAPRRKALEEEIQMDERRLKEKKEKFGVVAP